MFEKIKEWAMIIGALVVGGAFALVYLVSMWSATMGGK